MNSIKVVIHRCSASIHQILSVAFLSVESADAPVTAPADSMQSERPHGGEPEAPGGLSGEAGSRRHTTQLMANQPVVIEETFKHMMRLREARCSTQGI